MNNKEFKREQKEKNPIIAICYDFDKTLTPDDMQAQGYIQSIKKNVEEFWKESNALAKKNDMDQNLAWMLKMKEKAEGQILFRKDKFRKYGSKIKFFPGVKKWFERIKNYGKKQNIIIEHYVISSGLKEMIEGTSIFKHFKKVFASSFYYNEQGVGVWPAQVINYTNKTQFLFRIEKGTLDINDPAVNEHFSQEQIRIPFENIIYIGDSDTDIPCMKVVNSYGGHSIGVYDLDTKDKTKVYKMMNQERIKYFVPADYSKGKELDCLVKSIIDRTKFNERLKSIYFSNKQETDDIYNKKNEEEMKKVNFTIALEYSPNFISTHTIIKEMSKLDWNREERAKIYEIATKNNQVSFILKDEDISSFYKKLLDLDEKDGLDDNALKIKDKLEQ